MPKSSESDVRKLARDFRRWGRRATKRVQAMTKKYGVIANTVDYAKDGKG